MLHNPHSDNTDCLKCYEPYKMDIGKGDYRVSSEVDLYRMNSNEFDFGNIRFFSESTPFVICNTTVPRLYVDDKFKERKVLISGTKGMWHSISGEFSLTLPVGNQHGFVHVRGMLTDKFGRSPQKLDQVIACWDHAGNLCDTPAQSKEQKQWILDFIGCFRIILILKKEYELSNNYNSAEIYFTTEDYEPLMRTYKFGHQYKKDSLFLYPLLLENTYGERIPFSQFDLTLPQKVISLLWVSIN
ncbi:hypothetical protein CM50_15340 [Bacillus subtilis]|nr:hypothetical protein CM50_15340 [Bacillus subtilis] [Bacillus stercoris]